jgi:hypothetical protein
MTEKYYLPAEQDELRTDRGRVVFHFAQIVYSMAQIARASGIEIGAIQPWVIWVGERAADVAREMRENPLKMVADVRRRAKQPINGNGENASVEKYSQFE